MPLDLEKIDLGGFGINKEEVEQDDTDIKLRANFSEAAKINPDEQAHVTELSRQSGVPEFAVKSNPAEVESKLKLDKIDFGQMSKRSPNTAKYLVEPNNAVIAQDDVDVLESIENTLMSGFAAIGPYDPRTAGKKPVPTGFTAESARADVVEKLKTANVPMEVNATPRNMLQGVTLTPEGYAQVDVFAALKGKHPAQTGTQESVDKGIELPESDIDRLETAASQFVRGASGVLTSIPKTLSIESAAGTKQIIINTPGGGKLLQDASTGDPVAALALAEFNRAHDPRITHGYQAAERMDDFIEKTFEVNPEYADEFFAGKLPQGLGSTIGFLAATVATRGVGVLGGAGAGYAANAQSQFDDAIASGASIDDAVKSSRLAGVMGMSEVLPISGLLDKLDKGTGGSIKRAIKEALKQGTEEAVQESMQTIWSNIIASDLVEYDPERKMFTGAGEAAGTGFTVGALMTTLGFMVTGGKRRGGTQPPQPSVDETRTQVEQNQLEKIHADAGKSKLRQRDKAAFRQFVEQADGDNNTHVFIDGTQVALYLQDKTPEEIDADPALQLLAEQAREASATGGDIQLPVADFAAEIAGTDHFEALRDSMTMSDQTTPPFRQEQAREEQENYINNLMDEAQANASEYVEAQEIYTRVRDQLVDTGQVTPANASVMAQIVPAWATAQARRTGKTVQQVYEEAGLTIEGPQTGKRAKLEAEQVMEQKQPEKVTVPPAPTPKSTNVNPVEAWSDHHSQMVKEMQLTPEQAKITTPKPDTDQLTGLYTDSELLSTVTRARESGEQYIYVESDTFNLGGMNKALGANVRSDAVLKQIAQAYEAAFAGMPVYRRGAGRFAAVVPVDHNVRDSLSQLEDAVARIVQANQLGDIEAPKVAGAKGVSLYSGQSMISSAASLDEIIGSVQQQIEAAMPQGDQNVNRIKTFQAWADRTAEQPGGVAARVANDYQQGRPGSEAVKGQTSTEALERADAREPDPATDSTIAPDVVKQEEFQRAAQKVNLNPEQASTFAPYTHRDSLTGWFTARDQRQTIARAQQYVEETGGDAVYVVADISNLGGLNLALGNEVADVVFRNMAQIVDETLRTIDGVQVVPFRHGGDEVSFVLTNASIESAREVMNKAAAQVSGYIDAAGLRDLPHAKDPDDPARNGSGIYVGVQEIGGIDTSIDTLLDAADARVEVNKKRPLAKPTPVQLKTPEMFAQPAADRNLFVAHNLSAENILAAQELGGLAAPSIAVARADISDFTSFGEVTLLAKPSFLEGPKVRTFDADIYSPRQPRATYDIDQDKYSELYQQLDPQLDRPDINTLESETGADDLLRSSAVEYYWLQQQGKAPGLKPEKVDALTKKADKLGLDRWDMLEDERFVKMVSDHYRNEVKKLEAIDPTRSEKYDSFWFDEDGEIQRSKLHDVVSQVMRYRKAGGKDYSQLKRDIAKKMRVKKTRTEYEQWVTETFNDMVSKKTLFKGFTPSGNRKYVEYNMLNVVKEMTQQLQAGETSFYGAGTVRSAYANEMKTIKQIQAKRDEIVSEADMEKIKEESSDVFWKALDELKPFYKFDADSWGYAEDAGQAIVEGRRGLNEAFNMTSEAQKIVDDLTEYLAALPTSYFEAKAQRPVNFSEFETAVVPRGMRKDALKVLKDAGLKIKTYDPKMEGSRADVIAKQKELLFQPSKKQPRGYYEPANSIIRLTEAADLSTFLHEFAHFMYEMEVNGNTEMLQSINGWYKRNAKDVAKEANSYLADKFDAEKQLEQPAFHGTPHRFDKFSLDAIGTGEGAQAYGWGLYFASKRSVAEWYRETLRPSIPRADRTTIAGKNIREYPDAPTGPVMAKITTALQDGGTVPAAIGEIENAPWANTPGGERVQAAAIEFLKSLPQDGEVLIEDKPAGNLYQVDIPEADTLLDWDKPLSEQSEAVRSALAKVGIVSPAKPKPIADVQIRHIVTEALKQDRPENVGLMVDNDRDLYEKALAHAKKNDVDIDEVDLGDYVEEIAREYIDAIIEIENYTGEKIYRDLVQEKGSDKAASEFINSAGIPGLRYLDGTSRGTDGDTHNYVIWDEKQVTIEAVNDELVQAERFEQPQQPPTAKAGTITEADVIAFLDQTTTGDKDKDAAIRRAVHEQFARGFEAYLMEGKAPSIELRNAFRTFARWLANIYRSMRGQLKVNLDDEMRAVFDRLLATEEQIQAAEGRAQVEPMFTDAAMAGMTDEEYADYLKRQEKVKDVQSETLRDKLIHQLTRQTKAWWKEERQDFIDEETEKLSKEQVHTARARLRDGDMKLDHATVKEMVGEAKTNKLGRTSIVIPPKLIGMTAKGKQGVHPDEAAVFFGYRSGAEMLNDLIKAPSIKESAELAAEARMVEKHGDILNDGTIEKEADEAVQNEERGKLLLHELKFLSKDVKMPKIDRQTIKAVSEERIGRLAFREIHPGKYRRAEIKAAQEAARMLAAGNKEGAAQAKMRQVMNYYLGMAATNAKNDTMKIVDRMARYNKKKVREEIQKAEGGYWEQISKILNRFEFRKSATLKEVESINTWMKERMETDGDGLVISNAVLNETYVTHWKNVPFSDLQGINDSVKNIEHVARYANKLTRMQEEIDFNKLVDRMVTSAEEKVKTRFKSKRTDVAEGRKWGRWLMAQMTKIPFLTSWMDGGERAGLWHQAMVQPFTEAYNAEIKLWEKAGKPVMDLITNRRKEDIKRHNRKIYIEEIDDNLYGHQILAVALNTGNAGNLKKMLLGEGWADPENDAEITFDNPKLQAVLSYMTEGDWQLVQQIWDQMDTLYPDLAEVHRRTTGLTPPKVEATPVKTPYGTFKGGYYPVKYDPNRDHRAALNEDKLNAEVESMFSNGASIQASVNAGATNERTGYYAPIRLSLDVVPSHFQEVIHYITHHDPVREVNRLIRNKRIATVMKEKLGPEEYAQMKPWLNSIAKDGREAPTKMFWDDMLQRLRFGVTLGAMGFKASTGIIQISGLSNSIAELGMTPVLQATRSILGSPTTMKQAWEFAVENSQVMEHRAKTMDREIKNAMTRLEGKRGVVAAVQEVSMKHIALIQTYMVDLPTWHAAYIKGMKEWGDETRAFQYADWAIENVQGSGATKDLARILRGQTETGRMFTMFMTFFSSLWNMERDIVKGARSGRYSTTNLAAKAIFLFTIPVLFEMIMRGELGEPDDGDDDRLQQMLTKTALYPLQSIPFIRDIANATTGEFGYNISPLQSIIEQGTRTIPKIVTSGFTDDEITEGQVKGATKFIGAAAGVPGMNQIWATGEHLYDVIEDGEEFTFRELLFGSDRE